MTLPIQFSTEASVELDKAATWYDEQRAGLGAEFMVAVDEALNTLAMWPHSGAPINDVTSDLEVRRVPLTRFPYHLAYLVLGDRVRILAVAHDHRRPAYWAARVTR